MTCEPFMNKLSIDIQSFSYIIKIEIIRLVSNVLKFNHLIVISELHFFSLRNVTS